MSVINKAKIICWKGTCKKNLEECYNSHTSSFRNKRKEKSTKLSKNISELKNSINYDLKWSIACKAHPYAGATRKCELCLTEKMAIVKADLESVTHVTSLFLNADTWINSHWGSLRRNNTRIYNLISVPQMTWLLLGDAIISSKADPHNDSKKEKRSYGKI